jgi:hypothetical protein
MKSFTYDTVKYVVFDGTCIELEVGQVLSTPDNKEIFLYDTLDEVVNTYGGLVKLPE